MFTSLNNIKSVTLFPDTYEQVTYAVGRVMNIDVNDSQKVEEIEIKVDDDRRHLHIHLKTKYVHHYIRYKGDYAYSIDEKDM